MSDNTASDTTAAIAPMAAASASCEQEMTPLEQITIAVLKARGSVKTARKVTVLVMQSGVSEKYGMVRLVCSPNGSVWYVVTGRPLEGTIAPVPHRHEREALKAFDALCQAKS